MAIDGDGARNVYAPKGFGDPLDYLENAGKPGNYYGVVTDNGKPDGTPVRQGPDDPFPGYYISATSYEHDGYSRTDPRRYVDSNAVIYIVVPGHWRMEAQGVVLGCRATVERSGVIVEAAVLDFGPKWKCGEASIACARYFGVPSSPKNGGTAERKFRYTFFPGVPADGYELKPA